MKKLKSIFKITKNSFCRRDYSYLSQAFISDKTPNFDYLEKFTKKKKINIPELLKSPIKKKEIKNLIKKNQRELDIEEIRKESNIDINIYINLLSIIYNDKDLIEEFPFNFHHLILKKKIKDLEIKKINEIYYYFKTGFLEENLCKYVKKFLLVKLKNNKNYFFDKDFIFDEYFFFVFSVFDHQLFFLNIYKFEFSDLKIDSLIIWNIKNKINKENSEILIEKFFKTEIIEFEDFTDFINYIENFLILKSLKKKFDVKIKNSIAFEKFDNFFVNKLSYIFDFCNDFEMIKCFKLFSQYADLIFKDENEELLKKIKNLDLEKILQNEEGNFSDFLILLNYSLFILKSKSFLKNSFLEEKNIIFKLLKKNLESCEIENYQNRLTKKHFFSIIMFLYHKNQNLLQTEKVEKSDISIENKLLEIINFIYKKTIAKNDLNLHITFKLFYILRYLIILNEKQKNKFSEKILKLLKNLEFSFAFHAKFWNYNENDKKNFKVILNFFSKRKIGSRKMKKIIYMALDNVDKSEREKLYKEYLKVKSAKIDLKKKTTNFNN